jgi:hypothetical protein
MQNNIQSEEREIKLPLASASRQVDKKLSSVGYFDDFLLFSYFGSFRSVAAPARQLLSEPLPRASRVS